MAPRIALTLVFSLTSGCSAVVAVGDAAVTTAAVVVKTGVKAAGAAADVGISAVRTVAGSGKTP